mmetsp:Transcript_34695/g.112874  ORF Transcript_34695/g.112874 Transcript_34695/m.112874 type:complete len:229 (+) Transcript_34695:950-1636(+)
MGAGILEHLALVFATKCGEFEHHLQRHLLLRARAHDVDVPLLDSCLHVIFSLDFHSCAGPGLYLLHLPPSLANDARAIEVMDPHAHLGFLLFSERILPSGAASGTLSGRRGPRLGRSTAGVAPPTRPSRPSPPRGAPGRRAVVVATGAQRGRPQCTTRRSVPPPSASLPMNLTMTVATAPPLPPAASASTSRAHGPRRTADGTAGDAAAPRRAQPQHAPPAPPSHRAT